MGSSFFFGTYKMSTKKVLSPDSNLTAAKFDINATSTMYSSILGQVRGIVRNLFPENFFRSEFVSNSIFTVKEGKTTNDGERHVVEKPSLNVNMNYEPMSDATFSGDPFLYGNMFIQRGAWYQPNIYSRIGFERERGVYVTTPSVRLKNQFDFTIRLNSDPQALDVMGWLKSRIGLARPLFFNNRPIEVALPPSLIATIVAVRGIDIKSDTGREELHDLLKVMGDGRITFKLNKSSGKYMYFYKYLVNIMVKVESIGAPEKEVNEKSVSHSDVKLSLVAEYNSHSTFILESFQNLPPVDPEIIRTEFHDLGFNAVIHTTMTMPISSQLENGMKMLSGIDFVTDVGDQLDVMPFEEHLSHYVRKYLNHLREEDPTGELLRTKVHSRLYRNGIALKEDEEYYINWRKMELNIHLPIPDYDHKFLLYANIEEFNEYIGYLKKPANIQLEPSKDLNRGQK